MLKPKQFQTLLLHWFDRNGRKHLPWQQSKTPYRVWISEIMLQQTQVSTVIPYFNRFMTQFPDIHSLANANEDEVLHLWAGLGYYSRARNLHKTAKIVVNQFASIFPNTQLALQALPGIGQSTASAILALAFHQRAVILDGNVKRVLTRLHGIQDPINEKHAETKLWEIATYYTPVNRIADYTQAMMDLGATLCTRGNPNCTQCPFINHCIAQQQNIAALLPKKKMPVEKPLKTATFLILKKDNQVLLFKRPSPGIWGGLWSFPELSGISVKKNIRTFCRESLQLSINHYEALPSLRHTFSHFHLHIFPILLTVKPLEKNVNTQSLEASQQIWYNLHHPEKIGLPKPVSTIMRHLL